MLIMADTDQLLIDPHLVQLSLCAGLLLKMSKEEGELKLSQVVTPVTNTVSFLKGHSKIKLLPEN